MILRLKKDDMALVANRDGFKELALPKELDDCEEVPEYVTLLATVGMLLDADDEEFKALVWRKWEEISNKQ